MVEIEKQIKEYNSELSSELELLCKDLHGLDLSLLNFNASSEVMFPNPYVTIFLKNELNPYSYFPRYTKENMESIVGRTNNNYVLRMLGVFEISLNRIYRTAFYSEDLSEKTLGWLKNEIKRKIEHIIPDKCKSLDHFESYVLLRNCLSHRKGIVNEVDANMVIPIRKVSIDEAHVHDQTEHKRWSCQV